jgi:hypothetical protein
MYQRHDGGNDMRRCQNEAVPKKSSREFKARFCDRPLSNNAMKIVFDHNSSVGGMTNSSIRRTMSGGRAAVRDVSSLDASGPIALRDTDAHRSKS